LPASTAENLHLWFVEIENHRQEATLAELFPKSFQNGDPTAREPTKQ
jgi:hypothetical protein